MDSRADGVEADALTRMDHSEFSSHRENGTLPASQFWNQQRSHQPTFEAVSSRGVVSGSSPRATTKTRTCQLGRSSTHNRNETRGVDDTSALVQTPLWVGLVLLHGEDGVFASPPNAFDVDLHG